MLFAVTFPDYHDDADGSRVEAWRSRFDAPHAGEVRGHVTLIFGTDTLPRDDFEAHVRSVAAKVPPFRACFATPLIWPEDGAYLLFALPQEGLSEMVQLHDLLYGGMLASALRTDLPYVPHMTLGRCSCRDRAAAARDDLQAELPVAADIRSLAILDAARGISQVATVPLGKHP